MQWKTDGSAVRTGYFAYAYYKNLDVATEPIHDNCCTFPFVHKNVVYEHCIDNDHSTLWCAIETNSNGTYSKWKNCDENCSKNSYQKQDHNSFELYNIVIIVNLF